MVDDLSALHFLDVLSSLPSVEITTNLCKITHLLLACTGEVFLSEGVPDKRSTLRGGLSCPG